MCPESRFARLTYTWQRQHPRLFNQPREINVEICLDAGARTFRASITRRPTGSARGAASLVGARLARGVKRFAKMPLRAEAGHIR